MRSGQRTPSDVASVDTASCTRRGPNVSSSLMLARLDIILIFFSEIETYCIFKMSLLNKIKN
jgi:hypothetical protein